MRKLFRKRKQKQEEAPPPRIHPYHRAEGWLVLPTSVVAGVCDPKRMSWIRNRDKERTALIEQDVLERGIDSRLILLFDERGVVLKDGHHRVDIAVRQGIEFLPIYFKPIGKIRKEVVPWVDFLELIGQAYLDVVH